MGDSSTPTPVDVRVRVYVNSTPTSTPSVRAAMSVTVNSTIVTKTATNANDTGAVEESGDNNNNNYNNYNNNMSRDDNDSGRPAPQTTLGAYGAQDVTDADKEEQARHFTFTLNDQEYGPTITGAVKNATIGERLLRVGRTCTTV